MNRDKNDLVGKRFGQVIVLRKTGNQTPRGDFYWKVRCDCGTECLKTRESIRKAAIPRCHQCWADSLSAIQRTHGETGTYLYDLWRGLVLACHSPRYTGKRSFAKRGITVHEPWRKDYAAFASWIREHLGDRPCRRLSLDRRDAYGNFEPGNLYWATRSELNRNKIKPDT